MRDLHHLDRYRQARSEVELWGHGGDHGNGMFAIRVGPTRLKVIASNGFDWDHVSVSPWFKKRTPTWEEMSKIRELFFRPDEVAMELHVAATEHISFHPYTLHLWRPQQEKIPLPPGWLVGPNKEEIDENPALRAIAHRHRDRGRG
jgi:hypothetical protein